MAFAAGLVVLAGTVYALFGPLITGDGDDSRSYHEDGLGPLAWALFAGYILGGVGILVAGCLFLWRRHQSLATDLLMVSGLSLLVLAGLTVIGVGWLVLPGACLAQVAILLTFRSSTGD